MFLFCINYSFDVFRPLRLAVFREVKILSTCSAYVSAYVADIKCWTLSVLSGLSLLSSVSAGKYCESTLNWLVVESTLLLCCKSYNSKLQ
jgi:hypothetical protein